MGRKWREAEGGTAGLAQGREPIQLAADWTLKVRRGYSFGRNPDANPDAAIQQAVIRRVKVEGRREKGGGRGTAAKPGQGWHGQPNAAWGRVQLLTICFKDTRVATSW